MAEVIRDGLVGEVTGGEEVWDGGAEGLSNASAFGEMHFDERAVLAAEAGEWMQGFDHPGALSPAAAGTGGEADHGDGAGFERLTAQVIAGSRGAIGWCFVMPVGKPGGGVHDVRVSRILQGDVGREPVLGEADPAVAEIGPDLGMLIGIEAMLVEELIERGTGGIVRAPAREHDIEERLDHAAQLGLGSTSGREEVELGAADGSQGAPVLSQEGWGDERVVSGGHQRVRIPKQVGARAVVIDGEIIDDRFHGEGERVLEIAFGGRHDLLELFAGLGGSVGGNDEPHASAGHAPEHPEAPEILAEPGTRAIDERLGVKIRGPGDDGLDGTMEIPGGGGADGGDVRRAQGAEDFVEHTEGFLSRLPFVGRAEEILFGDHLEDGADILGHAAVDEDEAILECAAGFGWGILMIQDAVFGHEPAAADAEFGVAFLGQDAGDEFHAGPDATAILPAAARAAEPFAEDGAGEDEAAFAFLEWAGE